VYDLSLSRGGHMLTGSDAQPLVGHRSRTTLLALLSMAIGVAGFLIVAEIVLRLLPVADEMVVLPVDDHNPVLRFAPNRRFTYSMRWDFAVVNRGWINNYGFNNDQQYDSSLHTPLLAVVGDSYIEALPISYRATLQGRLAQLGGNRGRVYSFGMSGAALSQYLAEAEFAKANFRPNGLVVVVVGNDFDESLGRYGTPIALHYFQEHPNGLRLARVDYAPNLFRRAIGRLALARYLVINLKLLETIAKIRRRRAAESAVRFVGNTADAADSERVADSRRVVDEFLAELPSRSGLEPSRILLVVDGIRPNLYRADDLKAAAGSYFDVMRRYLMATATRGGFGVIDMQRRLIERHQRDGARFELPADAHWNAIAHEEAATAVAASPVFLRTFGSLGTVP
jgi:hypothetical protein